MIKPKKLKRIICKHNFVNKLKNVTKSLLVSSCFAVGLFISSNMVKFAIVHQGIINTNYGLPVFVFFFKMFLTLLSIVLSTVFAIGIILFIILAILCLFFKDVYWGGE